MTATVGFVGLGNMGWPMARNLAAAGHDVRTWNRTASKAEGLGATVAGSPASAVEGAEVEAAPPGDAEELGPPAAERHHSR